MDTCVICSSTKNLNTQMSITVDGSKITVLLCDDHADDTTVKMAKEKYLERGKQIEALIEQAKMLGVDLVSSNEQQKQPKKTAAKPQSDQPNDTQEASSSVVDNSLIETEDNENVDDKEWISTAKFDHVNTKGFTSVGGQGAQSYSSYKVKGQEDILREELLEGKVKLDVVEGRCGQPIPLPVKRVDGTGTTTIRIVNSENDQTLQRRFKEMASQEHQPDFRHGYNDSTRNCPICRGNCSVNGKDCPKCKGSGLISIY